MLREAPHEAVGSVLDKDVEPLAPDASLQEITRHLATYNLVATPVADEAGRLLGVVTVDDVLDHLLPEDWREADDDIDGAGRGRRRCRVAEDARTAATAASSASTGPWSAGGPVSTPRSSPAAGAAHAAGRPRGLRRGGRSSSPGSWAPRRSSST